jgi:hypothetical protein
MYCSNTFGYLTKSAIYAFLFLFQLFSAKSPMSRGKHAFRHTDAARLIRAARAAGLKITGVTLEGATVTLLTDEAAPASDCVNPWDQVLENDADKKRAS